jgi:hypothetical protein
MLRRIVGGRAVDPWPLLGPRRLRPLKALELGFTFLATIELVLPAA